MKRDDKIFSIITTFIILFLFWLMLSDTLSLQLYRLFVYGIHKEELPHFIILLSLSLISIIIVTITSHQLFIGKRIENFTQKILRFLCFIPWELYQIILANLDVAYRVIHPKMPMSPRIIEFDSGLKNDFALTTLANFITLTPGTITIDVDRDGRFLVHTIGKKPADSLLLDKKLQKKVAYVFMEDNKE